MTQHTTHTRFRFFSLNLLVFTVKIVNYCMLVKFDNVIRGLVVIEPDKYLDNRGWYSETY